MGEKLVSKIDPSVNFIEESLTGFLEARYVRKVPEYFICYLSSQTGCARGCRFCHLTVTKQTKVENVRRGDYIFQASQVLNHYDKQKSPADYVHYNFMARGEALANPNLIQNADGILYDLGRLATNIDPNLGVKFNLSTIIPRDFNTCLTKVFRIVHPTIYYSLYSVSDEFRHKWMPNAMDIGKALELLKTYQEFSKKTIKIHHCYIEGENDSERDVHDMCQLLAQFDLDISFNLVRYNPYSDIQGKESSEEVLQRNLEIIRIYGFPAKEIPRVGFDVKASCGTFIE